MLDVIINCAQWYPPRERLPVPEEIVFSIDHGGLGDHLFWSWIPEVAKSLGVKRVFLNPRTSKFRNTEYLKFWTDNPFVDGLMDSPCTKIRDLYPYSPDFNMLDLSLWNMGLDDGKRWHEPKIYYTPKLRPEWAELSVYDPNYLSNVGEIHTRRVHENLPISFVQLKPGEKNYAFFPSMIFPDGVTEIETPTIWDYADLIHSCKAFYCLTSGGATLAAALGKPCTAFFGRGQNPIYHHSKLHTYIKC